MRKNRLISDSIIFVLRTNWPLTVLLLVSVFASILLQILPAFILKQIVDEHFTKGVLQGVWLLAWWYFALMGGISIAELFKGLSTMILGQKILNRLRMAMSQRLSELPMKYFTNTPVGDIMSRLTTDVDAINALFSAGVVAVLGDVIKIGGLLVALYIMAPEIFWIELPVIAIVLWLTCMFSKKMLAFQKQVRERIADIYAFIQEWLRGIRTVKAYALERSGEEKFREPLNKFLVGIGGITFYDSLFQSVMQTVCAVAIALALWLGMDNGTPMSLGLTVGTLAAVVDLVRRLFLPIEAIANEFQNVQQALAGIARVRDFVNEPTEEREHVEQVVDEGRGLEINGVTFAYGSRDILKGIDVTLRPGEKSVFIGRSGAGKTTLMNLVAGLYRPAQGTIRICGTDPYTLLPQQRRRLVGVVPQMPQIFDGTVRDNITLGDNTITQKEIETAVSAVGLDETIARLSEGCDTFIGEGAASLSSGEIQLLSLARAIAANPKILLLDEPTSGMDSQTEQRVFEAIRKAGEGRTILSISHRLSGVVDADCIYLMAHGKIVESGTSEELASHDAWYAMYKKMENAGWEYND